MWVSRVSGRDQVLPLGTLGREHRSWDTGIPSGGLNLLHHSMHPEYSV